MTKYYYTLTYHFSLLIGILLPIYIEGFLMSRPDGNIPPLINQFLKNFALEHAQEGVLLNIRMDILENIYDKTSSHLFIKDLIVELKNKEPGDEKHAALPSMKTQSSSSPFKTAAITTVRTGPLGLDTHSSGNFVSSKGFQSVPFEHGCWEMMWLEDKPNGSVICSFDTSEDISRNDAVLKAGSVYISFPAFTKKGLTAMRDQHFQHQNMLKLQIAAEAEELKKFNETKNPFKKMKYFRKAVLANEEFMRLRSFGFAEVPMTDEEFMVINDELMLYSKGSVWSKEDASDCLFVGEASLKM